MICLQDTYNLIFLYKTILCLYFLELFCNFFTIMSISQLFLQTLRYSITTSCNWILDRDNYKCSMTRQCHLQVSYVNLSSFLLKIYQMSFLLKHCWRPFLFLGPFTLAMYPLSCIFFLAAVKSLVLILL